MHDVHRDSLIPRKREEIKKNSMTMENPVIHMMTMDTTMKRIPSTKAMKNIHMSMMTITTTIMKNTHTTMATTMITMSTIMKNIATMTMIFLLGMITNMMRKNMTAMMQTCIHISTMIMRSLETVIWVTQHLPICMSMSIPFITGIIITTIQSIPVWYIKFLKTRFETGLALY